VTRPRVLLADDHKEVCDSVVRLLSPEFEVIGVVQDGAELLSTEPDKLPDVCVIDISMPVICGIEVARILKARGSKAKIVFLTVHEDADFVRAALDVGALGYVVKSHIASDLCTAIRMAMSGGSFISSSLKLEIPGTDGRR
jgi:DNA-binding NarL/FixJ family response regulator